MLYPSILSLRELTRDDKMLLIGFI